MTSRPVWLKPVVIGSALVLIVGAVIVAEVVWTSPVRQSVRTFSELISAANMQDLDRARRLCSVRYLRTHTLRLAQEGGIVGLPRNINKNFQAWREGPNVWLCPSNRVGPLYQFVPERGGWKFDGPIGLLRPRGEIVRMPEMLEGEDASGDRRPSPP
jgi:hypothetical protein